MSKLQPNCCLKIDFQKVDQHAGGKWLIHDTKRRNDNSYQNVMNYSRNSKQSKKKLVKITYQTWFQVEVTIFMTANVFEIDRSWEIYPFWLSTI